MILYIDHDIIYSQSVYRRRTCRRVATAYSRGWIALGGPRSPVLLFFNKKSTRAGLLALHVRGVEEVCARLRHPGAANTFFCAANTFFARIGIADGTSRAARTGTRPGLFFFEKKSLGREPFGGALAHAPADGAAGAWSVYSIMVYI